MREFANEKSRVAAMPLPARLLYTAYAGFTALGLFSIIVIYDHVVDFGVRATPQDLYHRLVAHYVAGEELSAEANARIYEKLLETTHAHLFTMPVLLLVAGHLFLLTTMPKQLKVTLIAVASVTMALHLLAPWIIYATRGEALSTTLYPLSGAGLLLSLAVMLAVPVWEMWA